MKRIRPEAGRQAEELRLVAETQLKHSNPHAYIELLQKRHNTERRQAYWKGVGLVFRVQMLLAVASVGVVLLRQAIR